MSESAPAPLILIVDDDADSAFLVRRLLDKAQLGHRTLHLADGERAIRYFEEGKAIGTALMVLDIKMPKVNGFEVLEYMCDREEFRKIKRFILTTSGDRTDKATAEKLGISGYIIKPLKLNSPTAMDAFNLMIDLLNFKKN